MKRALIVCSAFPPLGRVGASIRLVKFLEHSSQGDWAFDVVTQMAGHTVIDTPSDAETLCASIPASVAVHRYPARLRLRRRAAQQPQESRPSSGLRLRALKRFMPFDEDLLWALSAAPNVLSLVRGARPHVVVGVAPQFSSLLLAYGIARHVRVPLVVDLKDDWLEACERQRKTTATTRVEMQFERTILERAAAILVPTTYGIETLHARHPRIPAARFHHVPNGVDVSETQRIPRTKTRSSDFFTVTCGCGGVAPGYRDVRPFLSAVVRLLEEVPEARARVRVRFLGSNIQLHYAELLPQLGGCIEWTPPLDRDAYFDELAAAHVLLLVQMDSAPSSISGTLYEYAATGVTPVLLIGGKGATRQFLESRALGWAFSADESDALYTTLRTAYDAWSAQTPCERAPIDLDGIDRRKTALAFESILDEASSSQS